MLSPWHLPLNPMGLPDQLAPKSAPAMNGLSAHCLLLRRLHADGCTHVQGFNVGAAAVGSTISVYAIARLMMNLPAGMLADRHGRKPLLVWGPLITALGVPAVVHSASSMHCNFSSLRYVPPGICSHSASDIYFMAHYKSRKDLLLWTPALQMREVLLQRKRFRKLSGLANHCHGCGGTAAFLHMATAVKHV